ncbi:MAG: hypothetical protein H6Q89_5538, partial [Myxococcaceae bacterium]|nr:hypothetical protein [Myxococcaceae bacterium]
MLVTLGAVLLLASPPAAPVKVAVPSFTVIGMDQRLGEAWAERFVTLLGKGGDLKLITAKDIEQVLGLERQKQLLGCSDGQASCIAELAGALGVDAILSGSFAQSGASITATMRVLKAADGSQLAAATGRMKDTEALQDWLEVQAVELGAQLRIAFKLEPQAETKQEPAVSGKAGGGVPFVRFVPAIIGGAAAIGGVACFLVSKDSAAKLRSPAGMNEAEIHAAASTGRILEATGLGLMIGGGVAIAASVAWAVAAPRSEVKVVFVPSPSGGAFV